MSINKYAVIVAGGSGSRMKSQIPKQFILIHDKPIIYYTVKTFLETFDDLIAIVILPKAYILKAADIFRGLPLKRIKVEEGGETRFHSVKNGLRHVTKDAIVFVHDGVRCMVSNALISNCYNAAMQYGNATPAIHATDSIRIVENGENKYMDRNHVFIIQTPQTFQSDILLKAFEKAYSPLFTDEASVVEANGVAIHLVEGDYQNIKVTRPIDLLVVEYLMSQS